MPGSNQPAHLTVLESQVDYLTVKAAAGNVAGACSVPLLLLEHLSDPEQRHIAQLAYERCAEAMAALDTLAAQVGETMARLQHARPS